VSDNHADTSPPSAAVPAAFQTDYRGDADTLQKVINQLISNMGCSQMQSLVR